MDAAAAPAEGRAPSGIGPVLSDAYGAVFAALTRTWLAGVPFTVASLVATVALVLIIVPVAAGLGVAGGLGYAYFGYGSAAVAIAAYLLAAVAAVGVAMAIIAPALQAAYRAHWRHLRDGVDLSVSDGLREAWGSWRLNAFLLVALTAQTLGYLCFLVPGVLIEAALSFVVPAVVVHGLPLSAAVRRSLAHFARAPLWHVGLALVDNLVAYGIAGVVPVIGTLVALPLSTQLHLRAYLDAFPAASDGAAAEEPASST